MPLVVRSNLRAHGAPDRISFAIIGDTHLASEANIDDYGGKPVDWILAEHARGNRIAAYLHVGDLFPNAFWKPWFDKLQNAGIPPFLTRGNWDMGGAADGLGSNINSRSTLEAEGEGGETYRSDPRILPGFLASYVETDADCPTGTHPGIKDSWDNLIHEFDYGTLKLLLVCLECGPSPAMMEWAERAVQARPNHKVIVLTHSYVGFQSVTASAAYSELESEETNVGTSPQDPAGHGLGVKAVNGREMWRNYLRRWSNLFMTVSGHVFRTSPRFNGYIGPKAGGALTNALVNGDFSNGSTGWTLGTGWAVSGGLATKTAGTASILKKFEDLVPGAEYTVRFTISGRTAGSVVVALDMLNIAAGARSQPKFDANGTYAVKMMSSDGGAGEDVSGIQIDASSTFDGSISNIRCESEGQVGDAGNKVINIHSDYQNGEDISAVRMVTLFPYENRVEVRTFNPRGGYWLTGPNESFDIDIPIL